MTIYSDYSDHPDILLEMKKMGWALNKDSEGNKCRRKRVKVIVRFYKKVMKSNTINDLPLNSFNTHICIHVY